MSNLLRNVSATRFNQLYTIGARFNYYPVVGIPDCVEVVTESEAWELCGRPVVKVSGRTGGVSVSHLEPTTQSAAVRDVLAERQRQISDEGWSPEHDDGHTSYELSAAALCYINPFLADDFWPWNDAFWKPSDHRRNLIKATALLLAEIERLDRAEIQAAAGGAA